MGADGSKPTETFPAGKTTEHAFLNVYDPTDAKQQQFSSLGFGVYHSGLQVHGLEYTFAGGPDAGSGTGVMSQAPKYMPPGAPWKFKETIDLGLIKADRAKFESIVRQLQSEFLANTYDLMARNCNHFTEAFATRLGCTSYPSWINRAAKFGNSFRGFTGAPTAPASASAPVPEKKSVFETSPGYSLVDNNSVKKDKEKEKTRSASVIPTGGSTKPQTGGPPRAGSVSGGERKNPWRDPTFFPGKTRGKPSTPSQPVQTK